MRNILLPGILSRYYVTRTMCFEAFDGKVYDIKTKLLTRTEYVGVPEIFSQIPICFKTLFV